MQWDSSPDAELPSGHGAPCPILTDSPPHAASLLSLAPQVTIPCLMALVPDDANFWPLKQSATRELAIGREPSFGLEGEISRDCPRLSARG